MKSLILATALISIAPTIHALSIKPVAVHMAAHALKTVMDSSSTPDLNTAHMAYCAIAYDQGKSVGFIAASVDGSRIIIDEVIVAPNHEGKGIGSRMIETCLLHFLNQRSGFYKKLAVYVPAENKKVISLYCAKEFVHVPAEDIRSKNLCCLERDVSKVSTFLLKAKIAAHSLGV